MFFHVFQYDLLAVSKIICLIKHIVEWYFLVIYILNKMCPEPNPSDCVIIHAVKHKLINYYVIYRNIWVWKRVDCVRFCYKKSKNALLLSSSSLLIIIIIIITDSS